MLIGPNFIQELRVANVPLDGIAWGDDGAFCFREDVSQVTRDAVAAVFAKHDPAKPSTQPIPLTDGKLAGILVAKGVLTTADVTQQG